MCLFDFFIPLSVKTYTFESISGRQLSENGCRTIRFRHEQVKKTSRRSVTQVTKYCKKEQLRAKWNTPGTPGTPGTGPDRVSSAAARTPPSTRAGGQDDVSSNKFPQTNLPAHCPHSVVWRLACKLS